MSNSRRTVLYIGVTNNLDRRVAEHKSHMIPGFTDRYNCTDLIYFEDTYSVKDAIAREKQLKRWSRSKKEVLIVAVNPTKGDLSTSSRWQTQVYPHKSTAFPLVFLIAVCQYIGMVCIYCGNETKVTNSREQKRLNQVWRRRQCLKCGSLFTSIEAAAREQAFMVESHNQKRPRPFSRDQLFISIYESCKHRPTALNDATALTNTAMSKLFKRADAGSIQRADIVTTTQTILKHFDKAAAVHYSAFHKSAPNK